MFEHRVVASDGSTWSVGLRTRPRWRALSRRFGAWRRRNEPDTDLDPSLVVDLGNGPVPLRTGGAGGSLPDVPGGGGGGGSWSDDFGDDLLLGLLVLVVAIVGVFLLWWVVIPILLIVLDAVVVLLLFLVGFVARVAFGRPWAVRARQRSHQGQWFEADVHGWRNARELQETWVRAIEAGQFQSVLARDAGEPRAQ